MFKEGQRKDKKDHWKLEQWSEAIGAGRINNKYRLDIVPELDKKYQK